MTFRNGVWYFVCSTVQTIKPKQTPVVRTMKFIKLSLVLLLATLLARFAPAALVGPYTPDANTLFLLHLNEAAGGSVTANVGLKGGNFYSVNYGSGGTAPPVVTTMLGGTGYSSNSVNFANCE